jgi:phytoene dehydrogenase-like protein
LPGFRHDICSAIHPLAAASPFFRSFDLDLIRPPAALAHPFDDGTALLAPAAEYDELTAPAIDVSSLMLGHVSCLARHPAQIARFATVAVQSATRISTRLATEQRRALFLGACAHSILPLSRKGTAGFGLLLLALARVTGWPFPRGGSQAIADRLAHRLLELGGEISTNRPVASLRELPRARAVLCDVTPRQLLALAGDLLPPRYRRRLERWGYGPGVFKVDYALDGPIPWTAPEVAQAATVHLGALPNEILQSERHVWQNRHPDRPFVLLAQQSLFDDTRAPAGKHTVWAYCHVPHGSTVDMSDRIERQIERFAPGFRDRVLARAANDTAALERDNPNLVGGDIAGGANSLGQVIRRLPHTTPIPWLYLCSASTRPGAGVHGMCGHLAAGAALRHT